MSGIQKLHLEDAFDDTPQIRSYVQLFENDADILSKFSVAMKAKCDKLTNILIMMSECTKDIADHMKSYKNLQFSLQEEETVLIDNMVTASNYMEKHSENQQRMAEDLNSGMMISLDRFIQIDLSEVFRLGNMYRMLSNEHEQSLSRYMKLSTRRDNMNNFKVAENDLLNMKKKYHQTTLEYFSSLNCMQYNRKISLLQPLLSYLRYSAENNDSSTFVNPTKTTDSELQTFISNCEAGIEEVQQELSSLNKEQLEKSQIIAQSIDYSVGIDATNSRCTLTQKQGYLYLRSKHTLMTSKWERSYFFIQSGNLMCQHKNELAGSLFLDLTTNEYSVSSNQIDDRLHCLKIHSTKAKRTIILQAESENEEIEWVFTLQNVIKESEKNIPKDVKKPNFTPSIRSLPQGSSVALPDSGSSVTSSPRVSPIVSKPSPTAQPNVVPFSLTNDPIQFDIAQPKEDLYSSVDFQQRRVNPFDEPPDSIMTASICSNSSTSTDNNTFLRSFIVRFIGCKENYFLRSRIALQTKSGDQLIYETMRQIMVTRALYNIFKTTEFRLLISSESMRIIDQSNNSVRRGFMLQNISYWTAHNENKRLFGFISCNRGTDDNELTYQCHVFECDTSADEICHSISTATKLAYEIMINESNKTDDVETDALTQLSDTEREDNASSNQNHPMREVQGDERRIEGAESDI